MNTDKTLYDPEKVHSATPLTPLELNAIHLGDTHTPVLPHDK